MSATNRNGLSRHANDFYETPIWAIDLILNELELKEDFAGYVIDPGSGIGAIAGRIATRCPKADVQGVEIDQALTEKARALRVASIAFDTGDFLSWEPDGVPDLIIGNPPYSHAEQFVRHALRMAKHKGTVAMLLRLGWCAGRKRRSFWREHRADVCVLERRPSFNGSGTDATDYAWFVWGPKRGGRWRRLEIPEIAKQVSASNEPKTECIPL